MLAQSEKRRQQRVVRNDPMAYTIFSLRHWAEMETFSLNLSCSGVGFAAAKPLPPKTVLCIRSKPDENRKVLEAPGTQLPLRALVEVRWCHRRLTRDGPMYEIGAAYL
jgi:hypothetical protein